MGRSLFYNKSFEDTSVIGWITRRVHIGKKIKHFAEWCTDNNLLLNVNKTKELIVDFGIKEVKAHLFINRAEVEWVNFSFLSQ